MRTLIAIIAVLVLTSAAGASPTLVCDFQTGVTTYQITGPAWFPATVTPQTGWVKASDGKLYLTDPGGTTTKVHVIADVAASPTGITSLSVKACDVLWGCSSSSPFSYTRPAPYTSPANVVLVP